MSRSWLKSTCSLLSLLSHLAIIRDVPFSDLVWSGGNRGEKERLSGAIRRCLELAVEHGCRSIAFPALSCGAYRYPIDQAARIALSTAIDFLQENGRPELIRFVLFDAPALADFAAVLEELGT